MKRYALQHSHGVIGPYRGYIFGVLFVLIAIEIIWGWRKDKKVYNVKETFANLTIFLGFQLSKIIFAGYQLAVLGLVSSLSLFKFGHNGWVFAVCFVLTDLAYYWFHRISHNWLPLWAFHHVHHSSAHMNLSAAYRLNWFGALVSPMFFIPLAFLGFPPDYIVLSFTFNLLYQFLLHTEAVGKLGRLEGVLDTPSAHRVHHGLNDLFIDKNFGGVFIWWDRIFNTYQPETEKVIYGIPGEAVTYNPFKLIFQGFINLVSAKSNKKSTPL